MTVFKIQAYLAAVSGYDSVQIIKPDYVWTVTKVWRRWWFPWPRIEVGLVQNLRQAETKALRLALCCARIRRRKQQIRIQKVVELGGIQTKTVIWENGKVLDPTIWPRYWRIIRWLFKKPLKLLRWKRVKKKPCEYESNKTS